MDSLHREVGSYFGLAEVPLEHELVLWDGFDHLEKESAVRFYAGKTWPSVLAHLRHLEFEPVFRGAYFLEEWAVLSPPALAYYARAHLEFLMETLAREPPNEEFVFQLLGQLHQVFHMHKGSPFSPAQTTLLRGVVRWIAAKAAEPGSFEYFSNDIVDAAERVLSDMDGTVDAPA